MAARTGPPDRGGRGSAGPGWEEDGWWMRASGRAAGGHDMERQRRGRDEI